MEQSPGLPLPQSTTLKGVWMLAELLGSGNEKQHRNKKTTKSLKRRFGGTPTWQGCPSAFPLNPTKAGEGSLAELAPSHSPAQRTSPSLRRSRRRGPAREKRGTAGSRLCIGEGTTGGPKMFLVDSLQTSLKRVPQQNTLSNGELPFGWAGGNQGNPT